MAPSYFEGQKTCRRSMSNKNLRKGAPEAWSEESSMCIGVDQFPLSDAPPCPSHALPLPSRPSDFVSQALYKLYRLGGYGIVQEARAVVAAAAGAASDGSVNPNRASVPGCETADNGDVDDADVDTGDEADAADEADRARFVAFVLHSLAGESLPGLEG